METARAKALLHAERLRTLERLKDVEAGGRADRIAANQEGDMFDSAEPLTAEGVDNSVTQGLEEHLAALDRAEKRLEEGTYGYSVQSGLPIPDDRLEVDPSAELTVEEARRAH
jgi:DnaK suppressor protein